MSYVIIHLIREHCFLVSVIISHIFGHTILRAIIRWFSEEQTGNALSFLRKIFSFHFLHRSSFFSLNYHIQWQINSLSGCWTHLLLIFTATTSSLAWLSLSENCNFLLTHVLPSCLIHSQYLQNILSKEQSLLCYFLI